MILNKVFLKQESVTAQNNSEYTSVRQWFWLWFEFKLFGVRWSFSYNVQLFCGSNISNLLSLLLIKICRWNHWHFKMYINMSMVETWPQNIKHFTGKHIFEFFFFYLSSFEWFLKDYVFEGRPVDHRGGLTGLYSDSKDN